MSVVHVVSKLTTLVTGTVLTRGDLYRRLSEMRIAKIEMKRISPNESYSFDYRTTLTDCKNSLTILEASRQEGVFEPCPANQHVR